MEPLLNWVSALWQKRIVRVLLMGVIAIAIQSSVFATLGLWLAIMRPSMAAIIGTEIGLLSNFYLNNRFSFSDRARAPLPLRLLRFHTTVMGSFFCQWFFVFAAEQMTTNAYALSATYVAGAVVGFGLNYTGYRLWVWKHHKEPREK